MLPLPLSNTCECCHDACTNTTARASRCTIIQNKTTVALELNRLSEIHMKQAAPTTTQHKARCNILRAATQCAQQHKGV